MRTGLTPAEAQRWVLDEAPVLAAETVTTPDGRGRVLAEAVVSSRLAFTWATP